MIGDGLDEIEVACGCTAFPDQNKAVVKARNQKFFVVTELDIIDFVITGDVLN